MNEFEQPQELAEASIPTILGPKQLKDQQIEAAKAIAPALVKPGKIDDLVKFKKYFEVGLTHEEIADIFGVSREAVTVRAKKLGLERIKMDPLEFKGRMEYEMLSRMQKILGAMTSDKVDRASLSQLIMAFGILYDKVRLQRGESTQNIAALNVHKLDSVAIQGIKDIIQQQTDKKLADAKKNYNTIAEGN